MSEATSNPEVNEAQESAEEPVGANETEKHEAEEAHVSLYELEMERFRATLKGSIDAALDRYGFTMVHSLKPEEYVKQQESLGFPPKLARDFYNLGCVAAEEEDYEEAVKHLQQCLTIDKDFIPAYFNLGVVFELKGDGAKARQNYEKYCKRLLEQTAHPDYRPAHIEEREAEVRQIEHHLATLK